MRVPFTFGRKALVVLAATSVWAVAMAGPAAAGTLNVGTIDDGTLTVSGPNLANPIDIDFGSTGSSLCQGQTQDTEITVDVTGSGPATTEVTDVSGVSAVEFDLNNDGTTERYLVTTSLYENIFSPPNQSGAISGTDPVYNVFQHAAIQFDIEQVTKDASCDPVTPAVECTAVAETDPQDPLTGTYTRNTPGGATLPTLDGIVEFDDGSGDVATAACDSPIDSLDASTFQVTDPVTVTF